MRHIVWDWNGTLLNDIEVVVESVNIGLAGQGFPPIDADGYRTHFTRPVPVFYERLFNRPVTDAEWQEINRVFHEAYEASVEGVALTGDAVTAIELARDRGATQSLLSMAPHDHLLPTVTRLGLASYFAAVDGSPGEPGATKERHLVRHLESLALGSGRVVLIGDTPDDAAAARHVGAGAILYDGGSHHRHDLDAVGIPVVASLTEAVLLALA